MRVLPFFCSLLLSLPVLAQTAPSKTTPLESRPEAARLVANLIKNGKIMRSSDAKRGMRGYGLSVFQGTKIERFGIEVIGTLEKVQGGGDLVMIRVLDGPVVKRQSGIIQGMSGSPVYINGKLLGAIAIGFGFPKEPIGGVTPITQMLVGALPDNAPRPKAVQLARNFSNFEFSHENSGFSRENPGASRENPGFSRANPGASRANSGADAAKIRADFSEIYRAKAPFWVAGRRVSRVEVSLHSKKAPFSGDFEVATMQMRPCTRFLQLSGIAPANFGRWKNLFEPYGFTPVLGGGAMGNRQVFGPSSKKTGVKANLAPGAAIGVQLASGDIDATGVGTVTYRLGNRVLAFGHPMFGLGAVSMPMTTAFVHDIFPSYEISFKLASPLNVVGELQQDTPFAVGGTVGRRAQTIPMRMRLIDASKKIDRQFNSRLIQDALFTPQLVSAIAGEAAQNTFGLDSDKTVRVSTQIKLRGLPMIVRRNTLYAGGPLFATALADLSEALNLSQQNPFEKGALQEISLRAEVISGRKTAQIRRLLADRNRVKAGETVTVSVVLEPTNRPNEEITKKFRVRVPDDAPDGELRIVVSPADSYWNARVRVGGAPPRPGNLRELLLAYEKVGSANVLLLQASTPRRFLLVDRKKVANPPASWNRLVPAGSATSIGVYNETFEQKQPSGYVLDGVESLVLPVESKRQTDREAPDSSATSSATGALDGETTPTTETPIVAVESDEIALFSRPNWRSQLFLQVKPSLSVKNAPTTATPTPTVSPTATPIPTADATANQIARPAGRWLQKDAADFARGEFFGTIARADGTLVAGPNQKLIASTSEAIGWSVAAKPDGTLYLGTGNNARLYEIQKGVARVIYQGPEVAVTALAIAPDGDLYAGVSPGGRVYRFKSDGTRQTVFESGQSFVHALLADKNGDLWVATGGERGAIFKISAGAPALLAQAPGAKILRPAPFAVVGAKHIRALASDGQSLFAGTGDDATLLKIAISPDKDGEIAVQTLYEARTATPNRSNAVSVVSSSGSASNASRNLSTLTLSSILGGGDTRGEEITSVAAFKNAIFFGTLGNGTLYQWTAARGVETALKTSARSIYALQSDGESLWIGGGEGGELLRASQNSDGILGAARALDASQNQITALANAGGNFYAATANNAAIYRLSEVSSSAPTYVSNVFDAGAVVRFGVLRSLGTGATLETRSGNTLEPDATWSDWARLDAEGKIASPAARFLQYRATLTPNGQLSRVEALFRAPNRAPVVKWTLPNGGEFLSGKKTLTWSGTDPDGDVLRYNLEINALGSDKTQKIELQTPTQASVEWDTTKTRDGQYQLKLRASDAARNAENPLKDEAISAVFTVDNTAPALGKIEIVAGEGVWTLKTSGSDATSPLAGAEWRIAAPKDEKTPRSTTLTPANSNSWNALAANDGIFDSKTESIVGVLDASVLALAAPLAKNTKIEIRLRDAAGNFVLATAVL